MVLFGRSILIFALLAGLVMCLCSYGVTAKLVLGSRGYRDESHRVLQNVPGLYADDREDCVFTLEVMHVQDVSYSFQGDIDTLATTYKKFTEELTKRFPGAKYGYSAFVDSPIREQYLSQYCFHNYNPIGSSAAQIESVLKTTVAQGGDDTPEDQIGAMIRAALSPKSKWSPLSQTHDPETGRPIVRLMLMATDAFSHYEPGYGKDFIYYETSAADDIKPDLPECLCCVPNMTFHEAVIEQADKLGDNEDLNCVPANYPTLGDFAEVLKEQKIIPIILTGNWLLNYYPDGIERIDYNYYTIADKMGHPNWKQDDGLAQFWIDVLKMSGIDGFVTTITRGATDFIEQVTVELEKLSDLVCLKKTTPSPNKPTSSSLSSENTEKATTADEITEEETPEVTTKKDVEEKSTEEEETAESSLAEGSSESIATDKSSEVTGTTTTEASKTSIVPPPAPPVHKPTTGPSGDATTQIASHPTENSTYPPPPPQPATTKPASAAGGSSVGVIAGASAGAAAAAVAAGVLYARKFGMSLPFRGNSGATAVEIPDVDVPEVQVDREAQEAVTADVFF